MEVPRRKLQKHLEPARPLRRFNVDQASRIDNMDPDHEKHNDSSSRVQTFESAPSTQVDSGLLLVWRWDMKQQFVG
ncbi:hypothetical protein N1851_030317 [Merluccius polli]|uniref:Uncharacterized protein n=1 Tax=Merluccius polli TaxID=89951 RepID=A0AA47M5R3_MERPO|nr:hypothetical protein N1851_030317 [Merluccius polli]